MALCPGGVAEVLAWDGGRHAADPTATREVFLLRRRSGFVRLARRGGAALAPVVVFGQERALDACVPPGGSAVAALSRRLLGFVPLWPYGPGRQGLMAWLPLPSAGDGITVVVGRPLMDEDDKVDEADAVAAGLARFVAASEALWERHRAVRGGRKLVIL